MPSQFCLAYGWSTNNDLVGTQNTQNGTDLFVQQVEIQIFIRQPPGEVFHLCDFILEECEIAAEGLCLSRDLNPSENPEIALHRRKGEIRAERECGGEKAQCAYGWSIAPGHVWVACMKLLNLVSRQLFRRL